MNRRSLVRNTETGVWLLLMLLSVLSWVLGANRGLVSDHAGATVIALLSLAFFKARLVIRYFMEVRHAPKELRWACEAWVVISFMLVTGMCIGLLGGAVR